jgi:alkanesulfonate monooxygenase SsuD/methylene tetrahydromethanopterin reductase-like flavin-dependent oxidoreductase (luciferase family)
MIQLATEIPWQERRFRVPIERIQYTEALGYDAVFTAEGYGSDGLTPLGYVGARTERIKLGTRIVQVTGRPPALTAMAFQTLNHMTGGGRVIAGLGSASPACCEGFHGRQWRQADVVNRMRDYVTIMRQAFAGEPISHDGRVWSAPYRGEGSQGLSPMPIGLEPLGDIPIVIGAAGPQMSALAGEIGDGWMPMGFAPGVLPKILPAVTAGFEKAGNGKTRNDFQIWANVDVIADDDVRAAMRPFRHFVVTWAHLLEPLIQARGYTEMAERIVGLQLEQHGSIEKVMAAQQAGQPVLEGRLYDEAIAAVPDEFIDDGWLVGPVDRIGRRSRAWLESGLTGLIVRYGPPDAAQGTENLDVFRVIAEAAGKAPLP